MAKPRANLRLSPKIYAALDAASARSGATKTAIVEAALAAWFDPAAQARLEEKVLARLDLYDKRQGEIERDVTFSLEMVSHFVLYWLTVTEPLAQGERDAAHALGRKRHRYFLDQVAGRIGRRAGHEHDHADRDDDGDDHMDREDNTS